MRGRGIAPYTHSDGCLENGRNRESFISAVCGIDISHHLSDQKPTYIVWVWSSEHRGHISPNVDRVIVFDPDSQTHPDNPLAGI